MLTHEESDDDGAALVPSTPVRPSSARGFPRYRPCRDTEDDTDTDTNGRWDLYNTLDQEECDDMIFWDQQILHWDLNQRSDRRADVYGAYILPATNLG